MEHRFQCRTTVKADRMDTGFLSIRGPDRPLHNHATRRSIERSPLHYGHLADGEPFTFLEITHDPLPIGHLEEKSPAGLEHRSGGAHHATIVRLILEVAEAGKEIENRIEGLPGQRRSHITGKPSHLDAASFRTLAGYAQHVCGQVDPRHLIAAPRELDRVPPLAAGQVEDSPRWLELQQGLDLVDFDRGPLSEEGVVERQIPGPEPGLPPLGSCLGHTFIYRGS